jgi:hypothetical protein
MATITGASPPAILQWAVRRLHHGVNRWTQRRIAGSDRLFGWSAWSHISARAGYPLAQRMERVIDWLFWSGHCAEDYARIVAGEPLVVEWRMVWAALRVLALIALGPAVIAGLSLLFL